MIQARFSLIDHNGNAVTQEDYRGRWMLVYFGFTSCKVVCPRSLAKLSDVLDGLGKEADGIAPLYATVDPARDTPAVMKDWLTRNYPRFTGLTGTEEQVDQAKRAFRVFAERKPDSEAPDGYVVPHTAISYLVGPDGNLKAHFLDSLDAGQIASRIEEFLKEEEMAAHARN